MFRQVRAIEVAPTFVIFAVTVSFHFVGLMSKEPMLNSKASLMEPEVVSAETTATTKQRRLIK